MSGLVRLCAITAASEGSPVRAEPEGLPALAVFEADGRFFVTADRCTHGTGSLSEGTQTGTKIECPVHAGVFDLETGQALEFPCRVAVKTWPATVVDGWVCIARKE